MQRLHSASLTFLLTAAALAGCEMSPTGSRLSADSQADIRTATQEFASAVRSGNPDDLRAATVVDPDARHLSNEVIADTVTARKLLTRLDDHFHYVEPKAAVVASEPWLDHLQSAASAGAIERIGINRARLQIPDDGEVYLRNDAGQWKVELIPTLVAESNGQPTVHDPVVEYRFGVTKAMNEWLLNRLEQNEFTSKAEFDNARNGFWMRYLTYAANGKDPRDNLLNTLPKMPIEDASTAEER